MRRAIMIKFVTNSLIGKQSHAYYIVGRSNHGKVDQKVCPFKSKF
jgi:hypothetical protein